MLPSWWLEMLARRSRAAQRGRRASGLVGRFRPRVELLEGRLAPAVFRVTSLADSNTAGSGALRRAITDSNATAGPNEINILTPGSYNLSAGELDILNNSVALVNQSGGTVVINQTGNGRVLGVNLNGATAINVSIQGTPGAPIVVQGGNSVFAGAGIDFDPAAGGAASTLTLTNVVVQNNQTKIGGPGAGLSIFVNVTGPIQITNSAFTGNQAFGGGGGAILDLGNQDTLTIQNSTISNNTAQFGGGIEVKSQGRLNVINSTLSGNSALGDDGGGIVDGGANNVTLTNDVFSRNSAGGSGGAYSGSGPLTVQNSQFLNNHSGNGGAIFTGAPSVSITDSQFSGNSAQTSGGAVFDGSSVAGATLTIARATFDHNAAGAGPPGAGGALELDLTGGPVAGPASVTITNATIVDNQIFGNGGGIDIPSTANEGFLLQNDTITSNAADHGGGIYFDGSGGAVAELTNTIVALNRVVTVGPDIDANANNLISVGGDFIGNNANAGSNFAAGTPNGNGDFVGTAAAPLNPLLGLLQDNGGTATLLDGSHLFTEALLPGSLAIDHGNDNTAPPTDERGFPRSSDPHVDSGAYELLNFDVAAAVSAPGLHLAGEPLTFSLTVTNHGPDTSRGVTLTDTLPAGAVLLDAPARATVSGNTFTLTVPDLAAGASTSFAVTVLPAAPGTSTDTVTLSTHDDPNPANNTASASVTVVPPAPPAPAAPAFHPLIVLLVRVRHRTRLDIFDGLTGAYKGSLFPFGSFRGPVQVLTADVNGDGFADVIAFAVINGHLRMRLLSGVNLTPL
jgi:uncharacterized repeat protein (TIGR01451 family)